VAIDAPKSPLSVHIHGQVVIIQPVAPGFQFSADPGRPKNIVVIMLEKALIVSAHMVLAVTVKALFVGNPPGPRVFERISGLWFWDGGIFSPVATIIAIVHMAGGAPGGAVKAGPPGSPGMDVTSQATPAQKIVHETFRLFRNFGKIRGRQGFKISFNPVDSWRSRLLSAPQETGLVDNACQGPVQGLFKFYNFFFVAGKAELTHMQGIGRVAQDGPVIFEGFGLSILGA
jgi:hypothetical protein